LAGVYLLLFVPTVDVLFFQNPMVEDPHWVASYLPGRYAAEVAVDAGLSAGDPIRVGSGEPPHLLSSGIT
jgi:hypothetical protein